MVESTSKWMERDFIASNLGLIAALSCFYFFPTQNQLIQQMAVSVAFSIIFPIIFIRFIIKRSLNEFGFSWGMNKWALLEVFFGVAIFGAAIVSVEAVSHIRLAPMAIRLQFSSFLLYIITAWISLAGIEILFRGIMLFSWSSVCGRWAIPVQAGTICLWLFLLSGSTVSLWEILLLFLLGCISGGIAWHSKSLYFSFLLSALSVILTAIVTISAQ